MTTSRLLLLLALLPAGIAFVTPVYAAPPPVAAPSDKTPGDRADELATRALVLANKDQPAEAEPLLREAWGLKHSYDIAANLGIVEVALNKWRDAAELLTYAVKTFPVNGKSEHRKLLEVTLAKVLPHVASLTIKVNVDKAEVFVDGKSVGLSPLSDGVFVELGSRKIEARLQGYDTMTQTVEAAKGGSSGTTLTLRESKAVQPPMDTLPPPLPVEGGPRKGILVAGGVTAGAALIAGVMLTVVANGKASEVKKSYNDVVTIRGPGACPDETASGCQDLHDLIAAKSTFSSLAAWSFVGAGVVGAATVIYGLAAPRTNTKAGVQVIPVVTAHEGGVVVRGAW